VLGFIKKNVYRGKLIKFGETKIAEIGYGLTPILKISDGYEPVFTQKSGTCQSRLL
jgi:hypothetical protein